MPPDPPRRGAPTAHTGLPNCRATVRFYSGSAPVDGVFWTCALKKRGQVFTRVGLLVDLYSVGKAREQACRIAFHWSSEDGGEIFDKKLDMCGVTLIYNVQYHDIVAKTQPQLLVRYIGF